MGTPRKSMTPPVMTLCVAGYAILNVFHVATPCFQVQANSSGAATGTLVHRHHHHHHQHPKGLASLQMRLQNPIAGPWNGRPSSSSSSSWNSVLPILQTRGGSTMADANQNDDDQDTEKVDPNDDNPTTLDITQHPDFSKLQTYRMQQQILMQHRATILSEHLAQRGIPLPTLVDVQTPDGALPPQKVDWDCAMSTGAEPKTCLYSFDAQVGTKVVAPINDDKWISLAALNRLRRTDPSKVEPMWFNQWSILESWFGADSEYSLLQHVGIGGLLLNFVLQYHRLHLVLGISLMAALIIALPVVEYVVNRILVSGLVWANWSSWAVFAHAALPLKLFLCQIALKLVGVLFLKLVAMVKERLVEVECQILERCIPLTVGPGSEMLVEEEDEVDEEEDPDMDVIPTGLDDDEEEEDMIHDFDKEDGGDEEEDESGGE